MKPVQVFLFMVTLFLCLGVISLVFPREGIRVGEIYTVDYPSLKDLFTLDTIQEKDFTFVFENEFDIDSLELAAKIKRDSTRQARAKDSIRQWQLKLHYPSDDKSLLHALFQTLEKTNTSGKTRIMHYGDSQIEGDRITGYLRHKLQNKFGGNGPGLVASVPLVKSAGIKQAYSDNWQRYTLYGKQDSTVTHNRYGPLASFGRFTPIIPDSVKTDSLFTDTTTHTGWITFEPSGITYPKTRHYERMKLLMGNIEAPLTFRIYSADSLLEEKIIPPNDGPLLAIERAVSDQQPLRLEFESKTSPDVYGISLEGNKGIIVDNIAMRGSSGTLFRKINRALLAQSFNQFDIKLLILQFGGNVMPYIDNFKECEQYGRWFESQLVLLKGMIPDVAIIVIGPSDMGTFINGEYESYDLLDEVRDALKEATFNQGGVYWDLLEAMGGKGAMKAWVEANPSLAAKDYVHFNHRGAEKVAQMFYNALIADYNAYKD